MFPRFSSLHGWDQNVWLEQVFGSACSEPSARLPIRMLVPPPVTGRLVDAEALC